jgi:predicted nucleotidyltransferase
MNYNLPERIVRDISTFAKKYDIGKVVLFGSRARGTNAERSDVDIAVSGGDFDGFYWETKENTHSLLTFDIIDLNANVSDDLKREIEKDGVTIYEKT